MSFLFEYQVNYHSDSNNVTKLPFAVFSLTQEGLEHQRLSIGNQDAGCLYLGKKLLIGAVADGCTSGSNLNRMSHNQVGAYLGSYLAVRLIRNLITQNRIALDDLIPVFDEHFTQSYRKLIRTLNPWQFEHDQVLRNLLFTTVIFFLITEDKYLIAHCGDGDIIVNSRAYNLHKDSGNYFASKLISLRRRNQQSFVPTKEDPKFKIIEVGKTTDLNNLFIATDGFLDSDIKENPAFNNFFLNTIKNATGGFIDRKIEFRKDFLEPIKEIKNGRIWPSDDATFISISRIG